jgi:DNA-directed RNA polymerase specialized sigma24 family protein
MDSIGSISRCIKQCKVGNGGAQLIWERFFPRLVSTAEEMLKGKPWGAFDGEDVALDVLDSFFRSAAAGRYPELRNRHELWNLLEQIVKWKVLDRVKYEERRDLGRAKSTSLDSEPLLENGHWTDYRMKMRVDRELLLLKHCKDRIPGPEEIVMVADQLQWLLQLLGEEKLQEIALLKLENFRNKEIAMKLKCGLRTVERKLKRIRRIWKKEVA